MRDYREEERKLSEKIEEERKKRSKRMDELNDDENVKKLMKGQNRCRLIKNISFFVGYISGLLGLSAFGAEMGTDIIAHQTLNEFKNTSEYNSVIEERTIDLNNQYKNNSISLNQLNDELKELKSNDTAVEILKSSSSPLKFTYESSQNFANTTKAIGWGLLGFCILNCYIVRPILNNKEMDYDSDIARTKTEIIKKEEEEQDNIEA